MFTGEDPAGWIARAVVYFHVMETSPAVRVNLAHLCMEGSTIHFFNSLLNLDSELTWEKVTQELLERYGNTSEGDVFEQLLSLHQWGSVDEYILEFERLIAQIPKLPDDQNFGYFIHGLKDDIRGRVRSMRAMGPLPRSRLMTLTKTIESELQGRSRNLTGSKGMGPRFGYGSGSSNRNTQKVVNGPNNMGREQGRDWVMVRHNKDEKGGKYTEQKRVRSTPKDRGIRHLPYQELMERRQKGLCYKCGGKFHPQIAN